MIHMSLLDIRDTNISNKNHHKTLASRTIWCFLQEKILCGASCFHRVVFDSVRRLIGLHLQLNFLIADVLTIRPAIFQLKYTDPWIINQSGVAGVATKYCVNRRNNMVSPCHRPLFHISRTTAQNSIGFVSACQGNSSQHDRAQKNFRLAVVWNKGVWFNTDSSWRIRSLYNVYSTLPNNIRLEFSTIDCLIYW